MFKKDAKRFYSGKITRFSFIVLILFIYKPASAQDEEKHNIISDLTGRISKSNVILNWNIINPSDLNSIQLEIKKPGSEIFDFEKEISINSYTDEKSWDGKSYFLYSTKYKPKDNGVFYFRLILKDSHNSILTSEDLKIGFSEIKEFKLLQNSPNPFNPSTSIVYEIYTPTNVKLMVYDMKGTEIDVLVNKAQTPGTYRVEFNTGNYSNLASGIYFYKLETEHSSDIKKMIFTK